MPMIIKDYLVKNEDKNFGIYLINIEKRTIRKNLLLIIIIFLKTKKKINYI